MAAYSRSVQKAQSTVMCQMCQQTPSLKWSCIDCDLLLCDNCNSNFHSKNETLERHKVVDIRHVGLESETEHIQKAALKKIVCKEHGRQNCSLFCEKCSCTICNTCIINNLHRNHKLCEIEDLYNEQITDLKDAKMQAEIEIDKCKEEESQIREILNDGKIQYKKTEKAILQRESELVTILKKYCKELLLKAQMQWDASEEVITNRAKYVRDHRRSIERLKTTISETLQSYRVVDILAASGYYVLKLEDRNQVYQTKMQQAKFLSDEKDVRSTLQNCFGDIYRGPEYELVKSFKTNVNDVSNIVHIKKDHALIYSKIDELLQQVKFENNSILVEKVHNVKIYDMALMENGSIIFSIKTNELKLYNFEGQVETFRCFSSNIYGVHVNRKNEICVGISNSNYANNCNPTAKVIVFNTEKQVIKTYEKNQITKEKLFNCPIRIVTNYDDTICVIDLDSYDSKTGKVVCLEQGGTMKWKYKWSSFLDFEPFDITVTTEGMIIVLDLSRNIHCLNQEGNVTSYKQLYTSRARPMQLPSPGSLAVDSEGLLLVSQNYSFSGSSVIQFYKLK